MIQRRKPRRSVTQPSLLWFLILIPASLILLFLPSAHAAVRTDCHGPVSGKYIYDCTGLLTGAEIEDLNAHALAVEQAGAPTVVYLQARDATRDETEQDAINLMNDWDVQSRSGARDGFVMFLNLNPSNLRHGQVFLYAGQKHANGDLPLDELQRIYSGVMEPLLRDGETSAGIAAGLDAVAHDLRTGPPSLPPANVAARAFGRLPFNILSLLFMLAIALYYAWSQRGRPSAGPSITVPPADLAPAIVGALATGRIRDEQLEATILDFARRGLLQVEPVDAKTIQVRLLQQHAPELTGYELTLWHKLESKADDQKLIAAQKMQSIRMGWDSAKKQLRTSLIRRGWYAPVAAQAKRRPLYIAGTIGLGACVLGCIAAIVAGEGWAIIGACTCLAAGILSYVLGHAIPDTTLEGEQIVAPWRGFFKDVQRNVPPERLDDALPYLLAMGGQSAIPAQLQRSNARGYVPSWFRSEPDRQWDTHGFYPYWIAWHTSLYPPPPPSSGGRAGGGFGGGGAAGGGGGGGGAF